MMLKYYQNKSIQLEYELISERIKTQQLERDYIARIQEIKHNHDKERTDWIYKKHKKFNQKIDPEPDELAPKKTKKRT